jgi:hypothetical protein
MARRFAAVFFLACARGLVLLGVRGGVGGASWSATANH